MSLFSILPKLKKTRIAIYRKCVQKSGRELPSDTISLIFGECLYSNKPAICWSLQTIKIQDPAVWGLVLCETPNEICNPVLVDYKINDLKHVSFDSP